MITFPIEWLREFGKLDKIVKFYELLCNAQREGLLTESEASLREEIGIKLAKCAKNALGRLIKEK